MLSDRLTFAFLILLIGVCLSPSATKMGGTPTRLSASRVNIRFRSRLLGNDGAAFSLVDIGSSYSAFPCLSFWDFRRTLAPVEPPPGRHLTQRRGL